MYSVTFLSRIVIREALHCQTDHHPSFLRLSLILGCLQVGGNNGLGVPFVVV